MANSLELQQVICPSCKQVITSFSPFEAEVECPFCHNKAFNPLITAKEIPVPERFIPFTTEEGQFESALVDTLVQQDYVPTDIFNAINTDRVFKAYLPMYLYEGTFNSSWSCESAYQDQEVKISDNWTDNGKTIKTKNVEKWRPQNGTAAGNFSFLCLANEGEELPKELREFTYNFPYDVMLSKKFDGNLQKDGENNLITIQKNADEAIIWQKHGKDLVDKTAEQAALNQIGNQKVRNFRAQSSFNLTKQGEYVLAPFWFVYYTYNDNKYNFMMDGTGQHTSYSYPVDQEELAFVNGKERIKKIVNWSWLLAVLMWVIFDFTAALITLCVWLVAKIVINIVMNKQIRTRLDTSRESRRAAAANL